jgi:hypothetical protein
MRMAFGSGQLYAVPVSFSGGAFTASPVWFATLQDVDITIDATVKELRGNLQFPDDVAISDKKITWKAGFGRFSIDAWNNLFFGDTIATGSYSGGTGQGTGVPYIQEQYTLNSTTYQVVNKTNFSEDMGVIYQANQQLFQRVPSGPTKGQYSVNTTNGTYTFAATDNAAVILVSYRAGLATGRTLIAQNHIQGWGPTFEMVLAQPYQELTAGIPNYLDLYACKCGKLAAPLKRVDYMISDLEGQAFANSAGYLGEFYED